jgi:NAD(P)-dependent dehydrogenase (short-subunit alcohol dehydrogenase family)
VTFDPAWTAPVDLLRDRVIVVTGASEGIGRAAARTLAAHGATVVAFARTVSRLESLYDEIVGAGHPEPVIQGVDLEGIDAGACATLSHALGDQFGRIDGLLHNASLLGPRVPLSVYDPAAWRRVLSVNLDSNFLLTQAFLPLLEAGTDPLVLFTSSGVGLTPRAYWGAYAVSKAGTEALMRIFADELENLSPIRFVSLNPGGTRTAMRAAAFPGEDPMTLPTPDDLMPLYLWLFGASRAVADLSGRSIDARSWLAGRAADDA